MSSAGPRSKTTVLAFRADGPYWSDLVHLLAYPDGVSYIWPFRYDARLIEPSLRGEFVSEESRRKLAGQSVLVGARFSTKFTDRFIPIRRAHIIHVDSATGIYRWLFRLGEAIDFVGATNLADCAVQISAPVDHLAFRSDIEVPRAFAKDHSTLGASWKAFATLVSREKSFPINPDAKRSIFLHIQPIQSKSGMLAPARIFKSWSGKNVYGFDLRQGHRYELTLSHFVPSLEKTNSTICRISIEPKLPAANVEPNSAELTLIGNYGSETLVLGAAAPSQTWEQLDLIPSEKVYKSQDGTREICRTGCQFRSGFPGHSGVGYGARCYPQFCCSCLLPRLVRPVYLASSSKRLPAEALRGIRFLHSGPYFSRSLQHLPLRVLQFRFSNPALIPRHECCGSGLAADEQHSGLLRPRLG